MKKRLCLFLATVLMLTMITPTFAVSKAQNEDEYTFAIEREDGSTVCMAVSVENGIPRRLTESEYREIMGEAIGRQVVDDNSICNMLKENGEYDTDAVARRGITYTFTPTSVEDPVADITLQRRVSQIYDRADTLTVTATTSYERTVTKSGGLTFSSKVYTALDTAVKAKYSYTATATSSTSTSVVGTFRPKGENRYSAVIFTPYIATVHGVMTEYMSAMGAGGSTNYNCTIRYPLSVGGLWDGVYEAIERPTSDRDTFPPAA